jgi:hypothetical protein
VAVIELIRHVSSSFEFPVTDAALSTELLNSIQRDFLVGCVLGMVNCQCMNFCNSKECWELFSRIITLLTVLYIYLILLLVV